MRFMLFFMGTLLFVGVGMASQSEPAYEFELRKSADSVAVRLDGKRSVFVITCPSGIGSAKMRLKKGQWPRDVALRLQYKEGKGFETLEFFSVTTERIYTWGPLRATMPFTLRNAEGKFERNGLGSDFITAGDLKIGIKKAKDYLEIVLPANLFVGSKEVSVDWIDYYRG